MIVALYTGPNFSGSKLEISAPGTWVLPPGSNFQSVQVDVGYQLVAGGLVIGHPMIPIQQNLPTPITGGSVQVRPTSGTGALPKPPAGYSFQPSYPGQPPAAKDHVTGLDLYQIQMPLWDRPQRPRRSKSSSLFANPLLMMLLLGGD